MNINGRLKKGTERILNHRLVLLEHTGAAEPHCLLRNSQLGNVSDPGNCGDDVFCINNSFRPLLVAPSSALIIPSDPFFRGKRAGDHVTVRAIQRRMKRPIESPWIRIEQTTTT